MGVGTDIAVASPDIASAQVRGIFKVRRGKVGPDNSCSTYELIRKRRRVSSLDNCK